MNKWSHFVICVFAIFSLLHCATPATRSAGTRGLVATGTADIKAQQLNRDACLSVSPHGMTNFDSDICKCTTGDYIIDPSDEWSTKYCALYTKQKAACSSRDNGLTRYTQNEIYDGRLFAKCLCVPNGQFLEPLEAGMEWDEGAINSALAACEEAAHKVRSRSQTENDARLAYYVSGLPQTVKLLVNVKDTTSVEAFLAPSNTARSVKVVGQMLGRHGGVVYVYRRNFDNRKWLDTSDPVGQQGDPRAAVVALGPIAGPYFGFTKIDDNTYTCPSYDEFTRAVNAINRNGRVVAAKGVTVVGQFGPLDYILHFMKDGSLPSSEFLADGDQTYFFHDIAFHLASMLVFPLEILDALQSNVIEVWQVFEQSIESSTLAEPLKRELRHEVAAALTDVVDRISVRALFARATPGNIESTPERSGFEYVFRNAYSDELRTLWYFRGWDPSITSDIQRRANERFTQLGPKPAEEFSEEEAQRLINQHFTRLVRAVQNSADKEL